MSGVKRIARARLAALVAMVVLLAGCQGLGGEPRIVSSLPPPTPVPTEPAFPALPADMASGAAVFAARCTDCHGAGGAGDGPLVQSGQVVNAGNFLDPATMRAQRPLEWFSTITNGRLERLMPPWRDALTTQQRWDVAYYTYTLHYTPEQLSQGETLYQQHCAACHGQTGLGDGPDAAGLSGPVPSLQDQSEMALLSDAVLYNIITEGVGDPHDGMPGFAAELSDDERWALVAYSRSLSLARPAAAEATDALAPAATPEVDAAPPAAQTLQVRGRLLNGSAGAGVPAAHPVTLFRFPAEGQPQQFQVTTGPDDTFVFDEVPQDADSVYAVTTAYRDRVFATDFLPAVALTDAVDLTIYELTEDPSVLAITGMVTQVNITPDTLEVAQVLRFRNSGDRAYTTSQTTPDGQPVGLAISLPPGAVVPGFSEPNRYVYDSTTYTLIDTVPVLPGDEHIVQVVYLIPYTGSAIIEQPLNYPLDGQARLLVRPPETRVQGELFPALGPQTIGENTYAAYGDTQQLAAGTVLGYTLSGRGGQTTLGETAVVTEAALPVLVVAVVVLEVALIAGLALWFLRRRRRFSTQAPGRVSRRALLDALVQQIAELDAEHEAGRLAAEEYAQQRAVLKARLAEVMRENGAD
jgi:mono/diheme cytochrome c family protein